MRRTSKPKPRPTNGRRYNFTPATEKDRQFVMFLIRNARIQRDLSPLEAAEQVGISRGTFYRWERGDISSVTVNILAWLFKDPTKSHDAFYWRERALAAEQIVEAISRRVHQYEDDRANFVEQERNRR